MRAHRSRRSRSHASAWECSSGGSASLKSEDYRGCGVGTAFFQWLKETWSGKAVALALQTTPSNVKAVAFYQRMGFRASPNHHLMKLLETSQD